MFEPIVEIHHIMEVVGDFKRPFVEASALLKSKHLMECGITARTAHQIHVMGLCLQTSHLDGKPHQVDIKINVQASSDDRLCCTCTCKAGSGKCKHIVAVLLYLSR
jgi:SWIM zinc finger